MIEYRLQRLNADYSDWGRGIMRISLVMVLVWGFTAMVYAQGKPAEENKPKEVIVVREVEGVISALSGNFIAIECGLNSVGNAAVEMAFNLDKKVQVVHKKSLKEISVGDRVSVTYNEIIKEEEGRKIARRLVTAITFLAAGQKQPQIEPPPPAASEEMEPLEIKEIKE